MGLFCKCLNKMSVWMHVFVRLIPLHFKNPHKAVSFIAFKNKVFLPKFTSHWSYVQSLPSSLFLMVFWGWVNILVAKNFKREQVKSLLWVSSQMFFSWEECGQMYRTKFIKLFFLKSCNFIFCFEKKKLKVKICLVCL